MGVTRKRALALSTIVTAGALALTACAGARGGEPAASNDGAEWSQTTPEASGNAGTISWGFYYEPATVDPAHSFNYAENQADANMCESLYVLNPDFSSSPSLAEETERPDDTTYVFTIRDGVTFWDGTPLTAEDVAFSLNRNLDPEVASYFSQNYTNVQSVEATGEREVTVKLAQPDVLFEAGLSTAATAIVQQAFTENAGAEFGAPSTGVMCTGPFQFDSWTPGTSLVMTKNENYWNTERAALSDRIEFSFLPEPSTQTNALMTGQLDGMYQVPASSIAQLQASPSGTLYLGESLITFDIIGGAREGAFADPKIRKALSLALDREAIASNVFAGAAEPANTLVSSTAWGYAPEVFEEAAAEIAPAEVDLEAAKALVAEAGSPTDTIVLAYNSGDTSMVQVANEAQSAAEQIGLKLELKPMPSTGYQTIFFDPETQAGVDAWMTIWYANTPEPLDVYSMFIEGASSYNFSGYSNADVNADLTAALSELDETKRAELVVKAQATLVEDVPWIPVVHLANTLYMNDRVTGAPASFIDLYSPWGAQVGTP
ncbi:ABC transporter substrate-binding protein [Leucobacter muris]|uniref:ABC transporter substrate-binding protein n=1 Tax=Leucobacter muris TaxID=1935379 RepID=A0ABX5QIH3_9MICO|nr:ABC transporter substrate-binding protein [Leucobacter muris]QAB18908.1 ABC transporter substrate-binding protein [Leucobacter muris]